MSKLINFTLIFKYLSFSTRIIRKYTHHNSYLITEWHIAFLTFRRTNLLSLLKKKIKRNRFIIFDFSYTGVQLPFEESYALAFEIWLLINVGIERQFIKTIIQENHFPRINI